MPTPTPTPKPARPSATERQVLAAARRIARRQLGYGYFRSIDAPTAPYVYCPAPAQGRGHRARGGDRGAGLRCPRVRLTEHLIDNDETTTAGR